MERRESQKKIVELEEQNSDLKHLVENQSLNIAHLESDANRVQQENEERFRVLQEKIIILETRGNGFKNHDKENREAPKKISPRRSNNEKDSRGMVQKKALKTTTTKI